MKLDRNKSDGDGKYAVISMRKVRELTGAQADLVLVALTTLRSLGVLNDGKSWTEDEFFVMMLKDRFAQGALVSYGMSAEMFGDHEYAEEIEELAKRAGPSSPWCKTPD